MWIYGGGVEEAERTVHAGAWSSVLIRKDDPAERCIPGPSLGKQKPGCWFSPIPSARRFLFSAQTAQP